MKKINIIGAGLAGLSAAITLAENNIGTNLISLQQSERAQSVLAEGGINGALDTMGEEDTPENHMEDTLRAGVYLADVEAVRGLTEEAPEIIRYLERLGVAFNTKKEEITKQEEIVLRNFGGQKKKRTAYARSSTGKIIMSALIDEARKFEAKGLITRFPHHAFEKLEIWEDPSEVRALETREGLAIREEAGEVRALRDPEGLIMQEGPSGRKDLVVQEKVSIREETRRGRVIVRHCEGVWIRDTYVAGEDGRLFLDGPVILAIGGMNGVFPELTTGTTANSGDALVQLFAQGVRLGNLEMIQYHPTTIGIPGKRCLVTEAARGEGGRLYVMRDGKPWYFLEEKYPELKNLMPRDVVSREIYFVKEDPVCGNQVYLDMTGLSEEVWKNRLPDLRAELIRYLSIDPKKAPIPVDPGIHYFMGGIHVDRRHCTNIGNLYAAGECCDQYHGANRLGGNSMLGAIYGGRVAARTVIQQLGQTGKQVETHGETRQGRQIPHCEQAQQSKAAHLQSLECVDRVGCIPPQEKLDVVGHASRNMTLMSDASPQLIFEVRDIIMQALGIVRNEASLKKAEEALEVLLNHAGMNQQEKNRIYLAQAIVASARLRKESRGAHYREDYPEKKDEFLGITVAEVIHDKNVKIMLEHYRDETVNAWDA